MQNRGIIQYYPRGDRMFILGWHANLLIEEETKMKTKRVLAVILAATTILGASLTAFAATETASAPAEPTYAASSVAGKASTTAGTNLATVINGAAVTTPKDQLAGSLGLAANEKAFTKISNFDAKKSTAAKAVLDAVNAALGIAKAGPTINFEVGKMAGGKYTQLENGAISASFAVSPSYAKGKTLSAVKVTTSGIAILPDTDSNPNTITVNTTPEQQVLEIIAQ